LTLENEPDKLYRNVGI